jgi:D-glycero-D-manno-heptose 1,7-bisphosphate phosphatase
MSSSQRLSGAPIQYVFLDRDGVINRKRSEGKFVTRWEELELLPGVAASIAELNHSRRKVIVVTNQRGVALGLMTEAQLGELHEQLRAELARQGAVLDAIYSCPHERNVCRCRKPQTGMLEEAFGDFPGARPENSVFIGDSLSDIECGRNAGMATIFITGEDERGEAAVAAAKANATADSLAAACLLLD